MPRRLEPIVRLRESRATTNSIDVVRCAFHALIATLFTVPMWIIVWRLSSHPEQLRGLVWLIAFANGVVWGYPIVVLIYAWRQQVFDPQRSPPRSLVRTFAQAQMVGILLAVPLLLWFGWRYLRWLFF